MTVALPQFRRPLPALGALCLLASLLTSCTDGPTAPSTATGPMVLAPTFVLAGPSGPALTTAQQDALNYAFDLVDEFHLQVTRQSNGATVSDTTITVTPGQGTYDLQVWLSPAQAGEVFIVTAVASQGSTELFRASGVAVQASSATSGQSASPTEVSLLYSGPGVSATSIAVTPTPILLGSGAMSPLTADVREGQGPSIPGVPLGWSSSAPGIATVDNAGNVTGVGSGFVRIFATTPTGLQSSSAVYVVPGALAYVEAGNVKVRPAVGGTADTRSSGGGASGPAWGAGGLFYAQNSLVMGESGPVTSGSWPAISPDGTKLAVELGGTIQVSNVDGSNPIPGPAGATPAWAGRRTLIVGGTSVQSVDVDGSGRTTLASGGAGFPAVSPSGAVAYVAQGALYVLGSGVIAGGVTGRPSWSADGVWLAFASSGGMMVVPADGSAPAVPLPGLSAAADPAWQLNTSTTPPPAPTLTGLNPDPPSPAQTVVLLGSGFDDVIQANDRVFWPGPDGPVESEVLDVTPTEITTTMPGTVIAGDIVVETRTGSASLPFVPSLGTIAVRARTTSGYPVPGVDVSVTLADGTFVDGGTTDASGDLLFGGLTPGQYHVSLASPLHFTLLDPAEVDLDVVPASSEVPASFSPDIMQAPLVGGGVPEIPYKQNVSVSIAPVDFNGNPVTVFETSSWAGDGGPLAASGSGVDGVLTGQYPTTAGGAYFTVSLNGILFSYTATVTSYIDGYVLDIDYSPSAPVSGVVVHVVAKDGTTVTVVTDSNGYFHVDGLLAGSYTTTMEVPVPYYDASTINPWSSVLGVRTPTETILFSLTAG